MKEKGTATLSNSRGFTWFQYGDDVIRFATPYSLIKYVKVKKWDDGYLVVDADRFLLPIKKVEIEDHPDIYQG